MMCLLLVGWQAARRAQMAEDERKKAEEEHRIKREQVGLLAFSLSLRPVFTLQYNPFFLHSLNCNCLDFFIYLHAPLPQKV